MKKEIRIILFVATILSVSSCDFLRGVAGRPKSSEIEAISKRIQRAAFVKDSIALEEKRAREQYRKYIQDSISGAQSLSEMGVKLSRVFSFGYPLDPLPGKYNVMMGVYRTNEASSKQFMQLQNAGFEPFYINFKGGVRAVCLFCADNLSAIAETVSKARERGVCPRDAWVFEDIRKDNLFLKRTE